MVLDPAAARAMVLERYPETVIVHAGWYKIFSYAACGRGNALTGRCKTEDAAWISAARRIKRQKGER